MTMEADPPAAGATDRDIPTPAAQSAAERSDGPRCDPNNDENPSGRAVPAAAAGVAALLALFAILSWSASRQKCMTLDEPMHALGGWLWTHERDYRFDPEDPPLWGYWMSLPNRRDALRVDFGD